jgi:hypothetical protein
LHPRPWVVKALTLLMPALLLGGAAAHVLLVSGEGEHGPQQAVDNAGWVLNGRRLQRPVNERIESDLVEYRPQILIVGNSTAHTNVDPKTIAQELGIPRAEVKVFAIPNAVTPHWYAMLKNRVYGQGHEAPVVVVVASLRSLLSTEPYTDASFGNLLVQMEPSEPVIERFVDRQSSWAASIHQRRLATRSALLDGLRDGSVALVLGDPPEVTQQSMDRLFHHSNLDHTRQTASMPVTDLQQREGKLGADELPAPISSMLPALAALANAHGTRLVLIRPPMAPHTPPERQDTVLPDVSREVGSLMRATGHRYVDKSGVELPASLYDNLSHLNEEGARLFSMEVVQDLRRAWERSPRGYQLLLDGD